MHDGFVLEWLMRSGWGPSRLDKLLHALTELSDLCQHSLREVRTLPGQLLPAGTQKMKAVTAKLDV